MKLLFSVVLLCAFKNINAQRYQQMSSNRDNYISVGIAYPYTGVKLGLQLKPDLFIEGQALTDGGAIWKEDEYNDWRCLTILKGWQLPYVNSKLKFGGGLIQTEELHLLSIRYAFKPQYNWPIQFQLSKIVLSAGASLTPLARL